MEEIADRLAAIPGVVGARRGNAAYCAGRLARAAIATAHARLAERGEWALNEKGIVERASCWGLELP